MAFRFCEFELNEVTREIIRRGEFVSVEPKVFDLLCLLVRHHRRVLPRGLLLHEIWPGVAVSEASLSRLVKEARRAIGDRGDRQELIRTIRGKGYRFVAEVRSDPADEGQGEAERLILHARLSLEAAVDQGSRELHSQIEEFVRTCRIAIASIRDGVK